MNNTIKTCVENLRSSLNNMSIDTFVVDTLEVLMQIERKEYLDNTINDKGNGFYSRAFKTLTRNSMIIDIPRTRTGSFKPELLELVRINQEQVDHFCLSLYQKGMTTRDVEDLMESFFGESVSHSKVSYLAEAFNEIRLNWLNTSLQSKYLVIFCDCIFITVRRYDRYENEAVYLCFGVREDCKRELLALEINPSESSSFWEDVLIDLKKRGVGEIDLIVSDGLSGMKDTILKCFNGSNHQSCAVHKMRNILKRVSHKEKEAVAEDLKEIFDNFDVTSTKEQAINKCKLFIEKWRCKYDFSKYFREDELDSLFKYIEYAPEVRRMIYTTNSIENLNRVIRKATKNKLSFESPERLLDYVFMVIKDFEDRNWMKYPVHEFNNFRKIRHN
jgi:transposase-like protein